MNNLKQWGIALTMYTGDYDEWFPGDHRIYYIWDGASGDWSATFYKLPECIYREGSSVGIPIRQTLESYGLSRGNFYCQSQRKTRHNTDGNWEYTYTGSYPGLVTFMGYSLYSNIAGANPDGNPNIGADFNVPNRMSTAKSDWVLMSDTTSDTVTGIWRIVNHWNQSQSEPAGGNVLHVGGDVRWFPWTQQSQNHMLEVLHGGTNYYYYAK